MTQRRHLVAGALALGMIGIAGCAAEDGAVELEFQTRMSPGSALHTELSDAAADFEREHPGIRIQVIPTTSSYEADMKVRLASGDVPDILGTHGWSLVRYGPFLEPLGDREWADDVDPSLDSSMRDEDGELYALPLDNDVAGLIVNLDVLAEAGVDPDGLDTWADVTAAAEAVAEVAPSPIHVSGKDRGPAGNLADWVAIGAYTPDELAAADAGDLAPGPYEETLELVADWRDRGLINRDYSSATKDDTSLALAQGDAAFAFSQNDRARNAIELAPDANIGFLPVPSLAGGDPYLINGEMNAYGIARNGEHVEDAARFLDFLAEPERISRLASAAGSAPGLTTASADLGALQGSYDEHVGSGDVGMLPYFDRAHLPPGMWNTLITTTDSILTGQSDPATEAARIVDAFDARREEIG